MRKQREISAAELSPHSWLATILVLLPVVPLVGALLGSPHCWSINHFRYLPGLYLIVYCLLLVVVQFSFLRRRIGDVLWRRLPAAVITARVSPILVPPAVCAIYYLFRQRAPLTGDGLLITDLISSGVRFRIFDNMDYLSHCVLFSMFGKYSSISPGDIYTAVSCLSGAVSLGIIIVMLRPLSWSDSRKFVALQEFVWVI